MNYSFTPPQIRCVGNLYPKAGMNGDIYHFLGIAPTLLSDDNTKKILVEYDQPPSRMSP